MPFAGINKQYMYQVHGAALLVQNRQGSTHSHTFGMLVNIHVEV